MADALSEDKEELIIIAAELLLNWDKLILLPDFNMCDNMSESALYLFVHVSKEIYTLPSEIYTLI